MCSGTHVSWVMAHMAQALSFFVAHVEFLKLDIFLEGSVVVVDYPCKKKSGPFHNSPTSGHESAIALTDK